MYSLLIIYFSAFQSAVFATENYADLLNSCLNSKSHKPEPGPESNLFQHCIPWKDHSCCTAETTVLIHNTEMYNFTYDHCQPMTQKTLSPECKRHFDQDMCFFECEPFIGPWKVEVNRKIGKERFFEVPLCASDCDSWFNACRNDYTCVVNWPKEMNFKEGRNICPSNKECVTFETMYNNSSKHFCEQVWDHSFKVTPDEESCMRISFNGTLGNPNERVAIYKIRELMNQINSADQLNLSCLTVLFVLFSKILMKSL